MACYGDDAGSQRLVALSADWARHKLAFEKAEKDLKDKKNAFSDFCERRKASLDQAELYLKKKRVSFNQMEAKHAKYLESLNLVGKS